MGDDSIASRLDRLESQVIEMLRRQAKTEVALEKLVNLFEKAQVLDYNR